MTESTEPTALPEPTEQPLDLLHSETEEDLRAAVRALLAGRAGHQAVLGRIETDDPYVPGLWKSLAADMGAAGLLVPEKLGGQGASHREAAVVLEELGRTVAPLPYLTSAVVATETLLALAQESQEAAGLLADLASGRTVAVLAVPLSTAPGAIPGPTGSGSDSRSDSDSDSDSDSVPGVADAVAADLFLVPRTDGLYAVPADAATVVPQSPLDLTRPLATVTTRAGSGTRLADPDASGAAVRRGLLAGAGLLASEQLGLAEWCLEETVRYTRERHQFNRPVGSFQALKHRMAQLWLDLVGARAAARAAADALATGRADAPLLVAVAQAYCSKVAVRAAEECVQLHGGIGMTWEHPAHLALKRAKSDQIALGSAGRHQDTIAALVGLEPPR
ncbi:MULTISPECIES: acyl-CoA dehydrogenase family protein [unclassified Streptomyces]|uniref:acyl-CoA dehydrogenase family protein n=1 Tax=unclassified Streptomyces TaxID=2593676 RepID=UPI0006F577CD|nr:MULTISPECIES: acyl-CoA dehydrogenase family protein [unclassified Streptomyces]KQX56251.1 acyl-CoA dehydrogenase [Streptomyces sp. Root1304]KRA97067.1 acyl-CoA dehydrogenase [Streptomyces sp. Root66D1]